MAVFTRATRATGRAGLLGRLVYRMTTLSAAAPVNLASTAARRQSADPTTVWIALTCLLGLLAISLPAILGRIYTADDLGEFHLPLRSFYAEQLSAGEPWDWMPSLFGGFYLTGEGQLGGYHPVHWLLYRALPLSVAFNAELLLPYPLMLLGTFVFLRRHAGGSAALFGAGCFAFGGFNLLHFVHPNAIAVVAHIPWLLWLLDRCSASTQDACAWMQNPEGRRQMSIFAAIALLTGSQLLLGYPQYVWFSLLAECGYAGAKLLTAKMHWRATTIWLSGKIIGLCLGAVQLLPTLNELHESTRASVDAEFSASGSLHPLNLIQLIAPYLFEHRVVGQNTHELGLYFGAVPCLLCCGLLLQPRLWGNDRRAVSMLIVALLATMLFAFGQFAPVSRLQQLLPLVDRFRFPCRAIVLMHLAQAALTALAFKILFNSSSREKNDRSTKALLIPAVVSLLVATCGPLIWRQHVSSAALIWTGPAIFCTAAGLLACAMRGSNIALQALAVFAIADIVVYGASYAVWNRTSTLGEFVARAPRPPMSAGERAVADCSINQGTLEVGNRMLLAGVARIDGYAGLKPRRLLDYSKPEQLRVAGVGWIYQSRPDEIGGRPSSPWKRLATPLPRARLVTKTIVGDSFEGWAAERFDVCALVEKPLSIQPSQPGTVTLVVDKPGSLELDADGPTDQILILAESFHQGWRATVDDTVVPVLRVNRDFLGCVVPSGSRVVRLKFAPNSLRVGRAISAGGLGLLVVVVAWSWIRWPSSGARG
jgi:hypothetical protein